MRQTTPTQPQPCGRVHSRGGCDFCFHLVAGHCAHATRTRPYFTGDGEPCSPHATGGVTEVQTCRCGAERTVARNGCYSATSKWSGGDAATYAKNRGV